MHVIAETIGTNESESSMSFAIFTTWTTYGTWLPGDNRGWFDPNVGLCEPDALQLREATLMMTEFAVVLDHTQRQIVNRIIVDHCQIRGWELHAVNCRSNHVHVLLSAETRIEIPREQFKAWCTRKLCPTVPQRKKWWTERGWDVYVDHEKSRQAIAEYIRNQ